VAAEELGRVNHTSTAQQYTLPAEAYERVYDITAALEELARVRGKLESEWRACARGDSAEGAADAPAGALEN
jgi:hypothetical protein